VLGNQAVTCTNGTITGDVGTFQGNPTGSVTLASCPVTGTIHVGDGAAKQAFNDFLSTYAALATTPCDVVLTGALTGTSFSVVMDGGGQACNVTWWVAQAATLTDSHFLGSILAGAAITLTRGTFDGNAWAGASGVGDVTITGTAVVGCAGGTRNGNDKEKCNQGVGNGPEGCDPGNSNNHNPTNDESGGTPGNPGRQP
jgi:Ice-binding-like